MAFFSEKPILVSDSLKFAAETNLRRAQAICTLFNSVIFLTQFFLLKEESTGRYINIRNSELYEVILFPGDDLIEPLVEVFDEYRNVKFPSLKEQFDIRFSERYDEFWEERRRRFPQQRLWSVLNQPVQPSANRLNFDLAVCKALGISTPPEKLLELYDVIVKEMIMIQGLRRD